MLAAKTYTRGGGAGASINDQVADDRVLRQHRRRRDAGPAGRCTAPGRRWCGSARICRPHSDIRCRSTPTSRPRRTGASRRTTTCTTCSCCRSRAASAGGSTRPPCRPAREPAVGTASRRGRRCVVRRAADRHRARARRRALPAARDDPRRRGARRDLDPPDRRRPPADPVPARPATARGGAGRAVAAHVAADGRRPQRPGRARAAPRRHGAGAHRLARRTRRPTPSPAASATG